MTIEDPTAGITGLARFEARKTSLARFEIEFLRFLDEDGKPVQPLPPRVSRRDELLDLYRWMVFSRNLDLKSVTLQRTGQLGTYVPVLGQEAIGVGIGSALRPDDVFVPSYREAPAMLMRGIKAGAILQYWGGDERAMEYTGVCRNDYPFTVTVGGQTTHAVGVAYALQLRGKGQAALCALGEGATSKGDFYEAINAAGVWKLPLVYVVSNNQYAISVPFSAQTACQTIAQKAIAAGLPGICVDGNDLLAVEFAIEEALDRARHGGGPTLVECLTYRLHDHTTADDASRYREKAEVEAAWKREPIVRFRKFLEDLGVWDSEREESLRGETRAMVDAAVQDYRDATPADPAAILFDHLYAELPSNLVKQREIARHYGMQSH